MADVNFIICGFVVLALTLNELSLLPEFKNIYAKIGKISTSKTIIRFFFIIILPYLKQYYHKRKDFKYNCSSGENHKTKAIRHW